METTPTDKEFLTVKIPLAKIDIPQDARTHNPDKLESLSQDMKDQGQIQAIVVCQNADRYEVVVGIGRVLAARKLGWAEVKAEVREGLSDFDKAHLTFSENEEREDADPFYQASQLQKMMKAQNIDQKTLAVKLNSDEGGISRSLGLLDLEPDVQQELQRCNFPQGHLTQIVRLQKAVDQLQVAKTCQAQDLSVRQLKALVDHKLGQNGSDKAPKAHKGNGNGDTQPSVPDPLADLWAPVQMRAVNSGVAWGVTYGPHQITNQKGINLPSWQFWVANNGLSPKIHLKKWLSMLVDAIGDTSQDEAAMKAAGISYVSHEVQPAPQAPTPTPAPATPVKKPIDPRIQALIDEQLAKGRIVR